MIGETTRWARGFGVDAVGALSRHLFEDLRIRRLTGGAMANNPAMIRVFEKLGFRREGVFRQQDRIGDDYIDHIHFGCFECELAGFAIRRLEPSANL